MTELERLIAEKERLMPCPTGTCGVLRGTKISVTCSDCLERLSREEKLAEVCKVLVDGIVNIRIQATEGYLDQDGKSIIVASDFKYIEAMAKAALARANEIAKGGGDE